MNPTELKERISKEFMDSFKEWLADTKDLDKTAFGEKYGYTLNVEVKDNLKGLTVFMQETGFGRWLQDWEKEGYDKQEIWMLAREKWLSYDEFTNWKARNTGHTDLYYISQRVAKEIYKASK